MTDKKNKEKSEEIEEVFESEYESEIEYEDESLTKDKLKKLRAKLKKCEEEKREYLEGWQRMKADAVNEKKRLQELISKAKEDGKVTALESIIPVLDSFEMAFKGEAWDKVDDVWKQGVEFIHRQFESALAELGAESFGKEGEDFDPNLHESVKEVETDDENLDNKVAKVLRLGYKVSDKTIRPAQVEVWVKNE